MGKVTPGEVFCGIDAPCKINLHLRVGNIRNDGFHNLESIFLSLAFGDSLRIKMFPEGEGEADCRILMEGVELPAGENIISRAVILFREQTGFGRSLLIQVKKRIPLGGGLGGGSSDGASILMALNILSGAELPRQALERIASSLGSDVPFFLSGGAAWVSGRGERIEPLPLPQDLWIVLVNPGFSSETAAAFAFLDRERKKGTVPSRREILSPERLKAALGENPGFWPYVNDFLPFLLSGAGKTRCCPDSNSGIGEAYQGILSELETLGADFSGLSGTGSTCFGIFTNKGVAEQTAKTLAKKWEFVQLTFPLARPAHAVLN
ncbi:MAG: 4-(cytidine 5'-diphospho)-2-C-methyl-D-erythritol kinase [Treponema sp.]|jgi:4-diphosphocytidyl-2-C-methyl-D-erythritol kinase|nr:4-(cytidine 5'-diphospho)-2-C-methyl-D-erythritol kinase [Treponema sp.]